MLRGKALTRNVTVPISAGLLSDTGRYFEALTAYREGDPAEIVTQISQASFAAVTNGRHLVGELREVRAGWDETVRARRDSRSWEIADLLLQQPVVTAPHLARALDVDPPNVYPLIRPLEDAGVLTESTDQKRNRVWRAEAVLAALDDFAARSVRRRP